MLQPLNWQVSKSEIVSELAVFEKCHLAEDNELPCTFFFFFFFLHQSVVLTYVNSRDRTGLGVITGSGLDFGEISSFFFFFFFMLVILKCPIYTFFICY